MPPIPAALMCAAVCLVLIGCATEVPDVRGLTADQARRRLATAGFGVGTLRYRTSAPGTPGVVAGQEPEARTQAPTGSRVVLTVRGPRPVVVPEVRGLDATAVASALTGADLRLGPVAARYDAAVPSGTVLTQEPAPRTIAPARALVSITVSKGPRPVRVPAVLGARTAQARVTLQRAGFGARITPVTSVSPSGTVLAQEPGPGRLARPGSSVQLIISRGAQTEP